MRKQAASARAETSCFRTQNKKIDIIQLVINSLYSPL